MAVLTSTSSTSGQGPHELLEEDDDERDELLDEVELLDESPLDESLRLLDIELLLDDRRLLEELLEEELLLLLLLPLTDELEFDDDWLREEDDDRLLEDLLEEGIEQELDE